MTIGHTLSPTDERGTGPGVTPTHARRRVRVLAFSGALGGFLFGFDSSVVNGAVDSIQGHYHLSTAVVGFAVASALLGCAIGAWFAGPLANRWGRIPVMVLGAAFFFASSIGAAFSFSVGDLIVWRVIGGLGIGIASVTAPAYIAEISPKERRGGLASLQQLAITLGIFAALLSDAVLAGAAGGASTTLWFGLEAWRWMFLVGVIPSVVYGLVSWRLPESPRYQLLKGREEKARSTLATIMAASEVDTAIGEMKTANVIDAAAAKGTLRGSVLGLKPIVWVGIVIAAIQQFFGINAIFYYSTTLWSSVGFSEADSFVISVISSVINVGVVFIAIALVDRMGRRPLMIIGSIGMTITLGTMAVAFFQSVTVNGSPSLPGAWGPVALVAANLYVVFFGATWGTLLWVQLGELFPNTIRAKAMGVATAANWLANFTVSMLFPVIAGISLAMSYGIFALFALIGLPFAYFFVPETKGVALEETSSLKVVHRRRAQKS